MNVITLDNDLQIVSGKKTKRQTKRQPAQKLNPEFVETVAAVVQNMMNRKEFQVFTPAKKTRAKKQTPQKKGQSQLVLVQEPFYAKNGGCQLPMITQGAERNVPNELVVLKTVGDKVVTLERYRARLPQYISVRKLHMRNGQQVLGLRETENAEFNSVEEAKNIVRNLVAQLS